MKNNPGLNHKSGPKSAHWKGGRHLLPIGYMVIRINKKYIYEHRFIMQKLLGRKLKSNEMVHHKNHNKLDNRLENLEVMLRSDHMRMHTLERWKKNPKQFNGIKRCGVKRTSPYNGFCQRWVPCSYHSSFS